MTLIKDPSVCHCVLHESRLAVSDSLRPHGLHSPWNSTGKKTGVGGHSLLQGIFPTQGSTHVSCIAGRFFTSWATRGACRYWQCLTAKALYHFSGSVIPFNCLPLIFKEHLYHFISFFELLSWVEYLLHKRTCVNLNYLHTQLFQQFKNVFFCH